MTNRTWSGMGIGLVAASFSSATAQPLMNAGFEGGSILCEIVEQFGVWNIDGGTAVGPTLGISPAEGAAMLQFQYTSPCCDRGGAAVGTGADAGQFVDLSPSASRIQRGGATATLSATFNRVAGTASTDTRFVVIVRAFDRASLVGLRTGCTTFGAWIAQSIAQVDSDSNPSTWERLETTLELPPSTRFLLVYVSAVENVSNGQVYGQEFDGHFADAVRLTIQGGCGSCVADVDDGTGTGACDGGVTIDDLLYYLTIFEQGVPAADVDDGSGTGTPDGGVTIDDLLFYLGRFESGC